MNHYNKLIRDKIPDIKTQQGKKLTYHAASTDQEFERKLLEKFQAEIDRIKADPSPETFADILEVFEAILDFKKIDRKTILAVKENKKIEKGGFEQRIILDASPEEMGHEQFETL
jgi:predicted house-cleaning noncanonical NTP pyrophosphatase (MazG superfamily)